LKTKSTIQMETGISIKVLQCKKHDFHKWIEST
jgi:hypothetical protein